MVKSKRESSILKTLFLGLFLFFYSVQTFSLEKNKSEFTPFFQEKDLSFSNRAQCAQEALKPAHSIFLIIDGYNAGKLAHSLGQDLLQQNLLKNKQELELQVNEALKQFRFRVTRLSLRILEKQLKKYLGDSDRIEQEPFYYCSAIKNFSALQSATHFGLADASHLESLAQAALSWQNNLTHCFDEDVDSRYSALQIDIPTRGLLSWNKVGFDFWKSFRHELSIEWRKQLDLNLSTKESISPYEKSSPYDKLFRSISLEESLMIIPNGCQSLQLPKCDEETMALSGIRQGLQAEGQLNFKFQDLENNIYSKGLPVYTGDFLKMLLKSKNINQSTEWIQQLRKNYILMRGSIKNRFFNALHSLSLLQNKELNFVEKIQSFTEKELLNNNQELYQMCAEIRIAADPEIDFLTSSIKKLKEIDSINDVSKKMNLDLEKTITQFFILSEKLLPLCNRWDKSHFWIKDSEISSPWLREMFELPPLTKTVLPKENRCNDPISCIRNYTESLVSIYSTSNYIKSFLQTQNKIPAYSLANPYVEAMSCQVYDPEFWKRRTKQMAFGDALTTVLSTMVFPLYFDTHLAPPKVTSLKRLVEDGVLKYKPELTREKVQTTLIADFGSLYGAPCAISISPNSGQAAYVYAFEGISLNYCKENSQSNSFSSGASEVSHDSPATKTLCGGCSLNFKSTASYAVSAGVGHKILPPFAFLIRGLLRYKQGQQNPVDIPRSQQINIEAVTKTFLKHGKIPPDCVEELSLGLSCYKNVCAAKVAQYLEQNYSAVVKNVELETSGSEADQSASVFNENPTYQRAWVETNLCDGKIVLNILCRKEDSFFWAGDKLYGVSASCRKKLK
ncbi:MAG TPA: hypothetical protein PLJ21_02410 [Pseudobdellovibrionaceae bacterium]|nr:hypothetical protein [Pseudobdellovibrionaceae bacterium]